MWSVQAEPADEKVNRLIALYDAQIQELEATRATPYWDGETKAGGASELMGAALLSGAERPPASHHHRLTPPPAAATVMQGSAAS